VARKSFQNLPMISGFSCSNQNIRSVQMTIVPPYVMYIDYCL